MFDRQIGAAASPQLRKANLVEKQLFNLTLDFTINDWRRIHTDKYFNRLKSMTDREKKEYRLVCVKYYLQIKNKL